MKNILFIILALLCIKRTEAQRVDLDRFNFSVSYRDFPENPLPDTYKTYSIRIEAAPSLGLGYTAQNFADDIQIDGLRKVEGTGHVTILLMMDDIIFEKTEKKERVQTTKDKQGNEVKKSFFSTELVYSFAARMSVYDYKGNTLLSNRVFFDRNNKRTFKTPESATIADADNYYSNKSSDIRASLARQLTTGVVSQAAAWLNDQYGYPVRRNNDILWILNNKRHPSYKDQQKAWNDFKNAIVLINENEPLDKAKEKFNPVIAYFEKVKKIYTATDKESRKMRYASYFNLAKIYIYLDEPEKALVEADALSMNDYDEKDGRYLRSMAESLSEKLRKNNADTRHFVVDADHYDPPVK
ncbi:MAG: hypothetical protein GC171_01795 [Terrimonas sp.]|nr:hypothetical protein [Terrimonas sp.]